MTVSINGSSGIVFNDASTQNTSPFTGGFAFRNRIINGGMDISQRGTSSVTIPSASTTYLTDRWNAYATQASKFTAQQTPSATETGYATRVGAGFTNYLACTSSAATSVGASDYYVVNQRIEGLNISDLAWGTSNAKTVTLSAWVYSSLTGTFGGAIQNSAQDRSYPFSFTISTANTWTQVSVTIAGDTSGTWLTTNGIGMRVFFNLGSGSTYSGTSGSWAGTAYFAPTGATQVVATSGATFYITGVQLEKGSTATSFDYRPYGTELALCQRYYWKSTQNGVAGSGGVGFCMGASSANAFTRAQIPLPVQMRSVPTIGTFTGITLYSPAYAGASISSAASNLSTVNMLSFDGGCSGTLQNGAIYLVYMQGPSSAIDATAEL